MIACKDKSIFHNLDLLVCSNATLSYLSAVIVGGFLAKVFLQKDSFIELLNNIVNEIKSMLSG
jgi:hypothetical protein